MRTRVCFVCLGNICRSPTAEGILRRLVEDAGLADEIEIDSAGTGDWHTGNPPDGRSTAAAAARGVALEGAARQFTHHDFQRFDYVVAMDRENLTELLDLARSASARDRISLLRSYDPEARHVDVPDPYYGGPGGFDDVFLICESACRALLEHILDAQPLP